MAIHPDIAASVAHIFDASLQQILDGEIDGVPPAPPLERDDVAVADDEVAGRGGPIPVRVYRPPDAAGALPALVWAHGGGWQYGDLDMPEADSVAQVVAATTPAVVVSVDYRLAPEHRFPAALDDVVSVFDWATSGALDGVDVDRVAVGGASSGANVAIGAALERFGHAHPPAALVAVYPVTDPAGGPYPAERHPDCPPLLWLDRDAVVGLFQAYVFGDPAEVRAPAAPVHGALEELPPTLVTTAEVDGLTPQVHHFAGLVQAAGVEVTIHDVPGVLHGYLNTVGASRPADEALERHVDWLRTVLAGGVGTGAENY